jgi:drug/metabolite transporter (DMT)-like permease
MTAHHAHRSGLLLALCGFSILSCGDAVIKTMGGEWPGTAVAALRFSLGAIGLGAIIAWREGRGGFAVPNMALQAARGLSLATASLLFFLSIHIMPLAEATAISFASPAIIALLSALFLGERIGKWAWLAMLLASAGVIAVLRPNVALLGWPALMPLVAAFAMASFFMLNRASASHVSAFAAQFWAAAWAAPALTVVAVLGNASGVAVLEVSTPDWSIVMRCAIVAITATTAHYLVFMGTMRASAASIAPASYVQILVALGLGIVIFGDWPDAVGIAGTLCIIAAGLLLWWAAAPRSSAAGDTPRRTGDLCREDVLPID